MKLLFASQNQHKIKEVSEIIPAHFELLGLNEFSFNEEIPETQDSIEGNALQKARFIYNKFKLSCFADDTGLFIEALNGEPGIYSARWCKLDNQFPTNIEKALFKLKGKENRKAYFKTVIAFIDDNDEKLFEGVIHGRIIESEKGKDGFGYDPIFIPEGYDQTFSEMPKEVKNKISHRAIAMAKFISYLRERF